MGGRPSNSIDLPALQKEVLGYLNFSSGSHDAKFCRNLNMLFAAEVQNRADDRCTALRTIDSLKRTLGNLKQQGGAFADVAQAQRALECTAKAVLSAYRQFHQDLLCHLTDEDLWQPFLLARTCEVVLQELPEAQDPPEVADRAVARLNDFIGHRPVAVLEQQPCQPYAHEWVRPIPLFITDAGAACGRFEQVTNIAMEILKQCDPSLLDRAWFDLDLASEIAIDPRAYDFDHPVNKRPNYHFGEWDPHNIDNRGYYRRFVVRGVTMDCLLSRVNDEMHIDRDELIWEAGAVLAGTILMASGTSGNGPGCHDSSVSLGTLLPHIAAYRDDFYEQLLATVTGSHGQRLQQEAKILQQPFGGARQHLNQEIARRRALQQHQVHLADVFARMGYPDAALRQADAVQVPSARILCRIHCNLTTAHAAISSGELQQVVHLLREVEQLLHRGIECGALVDPWNIVGFGGNFSLFPAVENSIHDYRVDELTELIEQILGVCAHAWSEAAAGDHASLEAEFNEALTRFACWWDRFATSAVDGIKHLVAKDVEVSANLVAGALNAWHKAGAAAGDLGFWRMFVDQIDSPKAFQLVVEALLEQGDAVASMALMVQWVSQADRTPLDEGDSSFHPLVLQWLNLVRSRSEQGDGDAWPLVKRFLELLEANAEDYWNVPPWEWEAEQNKSPRQREERADSLLLDSDEDEDADDDLYRAAYEDVVFRDSTADGVDDDLLEWGSAATTSDLEFEHESQLLHQRLAFLTTAAHLFHEAALLSLRSEPPNRNDLLDQWRTHTCQVTTELVDLLKQVHEFPLALDSTSQQALEEFDRRRMIKDALLEQIIGTCVETVVAVRSLSAVLVGEGQDAPSLPSLPHSDIDIVLLHALFKQDDELLDRVWDLFLNAVRERCLLYVPLSQGGDPEQIVQTRSLQRLILDLVDWLPRQGLFLHAYELLQTAQEAEHAMPVKQSSVTEFDRIFDQGFRSMVETLVLTWGQEFPDMQSQVAADSDDPSGEELTQTEKELVESLQQLSESMLRLWLSHSRSLRLSVVEKLLPQDRWSAFVDFIKRYGRDFFTQSFLHLGNLRAILHQGVREWLEQLTQDEDAADQFNVVADLVRGEPSVPIVRMLTLSIESIAENYREYRDYNATTTQSDRGELLYYLVDFLRLRCEYDRVAWNLRPVVTAHEILLRQGCHAAAGTWFAALTERTAETAEGHVQRHAELVAKYGMRLPSIASKIHERFLRPLCIDRVRALIRPAMDRNSSSASDAFGELERQLLNLSHDSVGAGLDVPDWIQAIDDEVESAAGDDLHTSLQQRYIFADFQCDWPDLAEQLDEISSLAS